MTLLLIAVNFVGIVVNAWLFIQLLKAKRIMEGYCRTAQKESSDLRYQANAILNASKRKLELEQNYDTTKTQGEA